MMKNNDLNIFEVWLKKKKKRKEKGFRNYALDNDNRKQLT